MSIPLSQKFSLLIFPQLLAPTFILTNFLGGVPSNLTSYFFGQYPGAFEFPCKHVPFYQDCFLTGIVSLTNPASFVLSELFSTISLIILMLAINNIIRRVLSTVLTRFSSFLALKTPSRNCLIL